MYMSFCLVFLGSLFSRHCRFRLTKSGIPTARFLYSDYHLLPHRWPLFTPPEHILFPALQLQSVATDPGMSQGLVTTEIAIPADAPSQDPDLPHGETATATITGMTEIKKGTETGGRGVLCVKKKMTGDVDERVRHTTPTPLRLHLLQTCIHPALCRAVTAIREEQTTTALAGEQMAEVVTILSSRCPRNISRNCSSLTHARRRRRQREASTLSIWPASPKASARKL